MREVFLSFILSLIFFGLFVYCLDNIKIIDAGKLESIKEKYGITTQVEFESLYLDLRDAGLVNEVINQGNFTAMSIVVSGLVFFTFGTLHLFVDKMFFKKFYEKPNVGIAARRAIIFTSAFYLVIFLRVSGFFDILAVLFVILVAIFLEIIFNGMNKQNPPLVEEAVQNE